MIRICILALLVLYLQLHIEARADMTNTELAKQAVYTGLLVLDYRQTLDIKNHPDMYEMNPLLGEHPGDSRIGRHFVTVGIVHATVAWFLPRPYKTWWQNIGLVDEAFTVARNHFHVGLQVRF